VNIVIVDIPSFVKMEFKEGNFFSIG